MKKMKFLLLTACIFAANTYAQSFKQTETAFIEGLSEWTFKTQKANNSTVQFSGSTVQMTGQKNGGISFAYRYEDDFKDYRPYTVMCTSKTNTTGTGNHWGICIGGPAAIEGFYIFVVNCTGYWAVFKFNGKAYVNIKKYTASTTINTTEGSENNLKVQLTPSTNTAPAYFSFYCNNNLLDTVVNENTLGDNTAGVFHGSDGDITFSKFSLVQPVYDLVNQTTTLPAGLTTIENAAAISFAPFKIKSPVSSYKYVSSYTITGTTSEIDGYLKYKYGPFTTQELADKKHIEMKNEIAKQRSAYRIISKKNMFQENITWLSKQFTGGYYDPHIYIITEKSNDQYYVTLKFEETKNISANYYITTPAKSSSDFGKSFGKIQLAGTARDGVFKEFMGAFIPNPNSYSKDTIYESKYTIDGTTNNTVVFSGYFGGRYYYADIASGIEKDRAMVLLDLWRMKIKESLGKDYYYNEKNEYSNGSVRKSSVTFKTVVPAKSPERDRTVEITLEQDNEGLYKLRLAVSSFPSWN